VKRTGMDARLLVLACMLSFGALGCAKSESPADDDSAAAEQSGGGGTAKAVLDDLHPEVVLDTSLGSVTLKLDAEKAPLTVRNFLNYVQSGHYQETIFHQVEPGHVVLGGGRTAELEAKPRMMAVRNEANNGLKNCRGTIAMFRDPAVIDSASCEFFINLNDNPHLDHQAGADGAWGDNVSPTKPEDYGYCVFGEVIAGMDVIEKIASAQVKSTEEFPNLPVEPIALRAVKRVR
jgi:peptidyl-prolyl cis-trans isomerase A (cyclophilin A)